jgi:flagellar motor switch protein FliN/FliY
MENPTNQVEVQEDEQVQEEQVAAEPVVTAEAPPTPTPTPTPPPTPEPQPVAKPPAQTVQMDGLMGVNLDVVVEIGRAQMTMGEILELQNGSVVELDRIAGDVVDVLINDKLMARGEVVIVDDKFGVRITEILSPIETGRKH